MAEKISDQQVAGLLATLRADGAIDAKVAQVNAVKSGIKQFNVPDSCVAPLFEALRAASSSQHAVLVNAGFTALNHLLTRLSRQEPKYLAREATRTLPLVADKMGDQKDKFRATALQALATLYQAAPVEVERAVRNTAMVGKNPRAKETSLQWLLQMHQENGLQFRGYVPTLIELLEDADPGVRDAAKHTVIELFRNAPNAAKSDLKRQLKNFKVRPAIEQAIVKALAPTAAAPPPAPEADEPVHLPSRPNLAASVSSLSSDRPITPMPTEGRADAVEPTYINTQRELEDIFREMQPYFEGRETEHNWLKREESMNKLRRLMAGNASDFADSFLASIRAMLDGVIKGIVSLRTSLSKEGCSLIQDLANMYGPGIDPMVEILMQTFIKLSAATKKIASQQANATVDTIIAKASFTPRIMQHVCSACQDKNVQPRLYATGWLRTLLKKEAGHKSHIEHHGGLDLIEKCLKKGLVDPNPGVREKMRATYWTFAGIWPTRAEALMDTLDAQAQKLLQNDPNNPNSPKKAAPAAAARPGLGLSKSTMGGSTKSSIREAMLAQKKAALAAKNLPARPESAMAHFSPVRTAKPGAAAPSAASTKVPTHGARQPGATGGLSGAPVRPGRRRPEMAPRPATAGPYSVRSHDQPSAESTSPPATVRSKTAIITPKAALVVGSPRRNAPGGRPGHAATASESSIPTPTKRASMQRTGASPSPSPARSRMALPSVNGSSPSRALEEFTLVVPTIPAVKTAASRETTPAPVSAPVPALAPAPAPEPETEPESDPASPPAPAPEVAEPVAAEPAVVEPAAVEPEATVSTPPRTLKVFEDPFTEGNETPRPNPASTVPVLEDKPVNASAAKVAQPGAGDEDEGGAPQSPQKAKQDSRLLDSALAKIKTTSLDVHGFRKLQGILRDTKAPLSDERFDALVLGLFGYLRSPLEGLAPDRAQDVKAQILATIRLLLRRARDGFRPHVCAGLEALLAARARYDARTHIVAGLELLAGELVALGDAQEVVTVLTRRLAGLDPDSAAGARSLSMGLHVLAETVDAQRGGGGGGGAAASYAPADPELAAMAALCGRCLESSESAVRMDAVLLCVALHARAGDARFWDFMQGVGVREDPKSLITYYIVKRQREAAAA